VDLEDATNELYALPPSEFTTRRNELAAQARLDKQTDIAKTISELRRPTVSAWLLNQLARGEQGAADEVEQLETLGTQMRQAQAQLDGQRMKELTRQRHELVAALVRRAQNVASEAGDQKVSGSVQRELEETLGAAVADEQASLAVTSGRLTRALVYAGLGEVDVTAATATPIGKNRRPRLVSTPDRARESLDAERQHAIQTAEQAAAAFATAEDDLTASEQRRDQVRSQQEELATRLDELQGEIVRTRHELDTVSRKMAAADREYQRQERQTRDARKEAQRAERALARLDPDDPDNPDDPA
jgi:hypothetical protein